jgi:hypothetical protein
MTDMNPTTPPVMPVTAVRPSRKWVILTVVFITTTVIALGVMTWAILNYVNERDTVNSQVDEAVAEAKKEEALAYDQKLDEYENSPVNTFSGPEDYGSVSFDYARSWSVYIEKDATSSSTFEAYLHPGAIPPVSSSTQFALRVTIEAKDYDSVINSYQSKVKSGDLSSSVVKVGEQTGTRLDGKFSNDILGAAVVFKIRDKTLTLRTDADTFKDNFSALVQTLTFNQ